MKHTTGPPRVTASDGSAVKGSQGFINTLMIQDILAEPQWAGVLGDADRRGLTPLFTSNMTPYGDIQLDTTRRLALGGPN